MRFELARMFLSERKQVDAFERSNNGKRLSREEWLRSVFGERTEFVHRKAERRYEPDDPQPNKDRIVGRIGRETTMTEPNPDNRLRDEVRKKWHATLLIIDPRTHDDGQKVAVQADSGVGSGIGNFRSLVASINARTPPEPYAIDVNVISDQTTFWEYVERHKGKITSITLEIATPNMFGGESSFEEDAKRLRDREKARRIKETIENPDGLEPDTERMREAVSYATRGGGRVKAKAKDANPYDSSEDGKYIEADVIKENKDVSQKTAAAMKAFDLDAVQTQASAEE